MSFPAQDFTGPVTRHVLVAVPQPRLLGDIVLAYDVLAAEAQEQGKPIEDHMLHLLTHGLLHLLGYDHIDEAEARLMEKLEKDILAAQGRPNPSRFDGDERPADERQQVTWGFLARSSDAFRRTRGNLRESLEDVLEEAQSGRDDFSDGTPYAEKPARFRDVTLDDVMVPRAEIDGLEIDINPPVLLPRFAECGHSRMPVYETLTNLWAFCMSKICCRF